VPGKAKATKSIQERVWHDTSWVVSRGVLKRRRGRPENVKPLFLVVGEKLPFASIDAVGKQVGQRIGSRSGVYVAQDSMGYARYIGRGKIFTRRRRLGRIERTCSCTTRSTSSSRALTGVRLNPCSYVRAGPLLEFNTRKRRANIEPGDVYDFRGWYTILRAIPESGSKARLNFCVAGNSSGPM